MKLQLARILIIQFISITCGVAIEYDCDNRNVSCGCGFKNVELNEENNNAEDVIPHSWSMMVSIRYDCKQTGDPSTHCCGGTILNDIYIITAASCFNSSDNSSLVADNITIAAGIHNLSQKCQTIRVVDQIFIHPDWTPTDEAMHNIAILRLAEPLDFKIDYLISQACFPSRMDTTLDNNGTLIAIGWGISENSDQILQQLIVYPVDSNDSHCAKLVNDSELVFCAELGEAPCFPEVGGPLFQWIGDRWEIVGIKSHARDGCPTIGYKGLFVRVAAYYDWIESIMYPENITASSTESETTGEISTTSVRPSFVYKCDTSAPCGCSYSDAEFRLTRIVGGGYAVDNSWSMIVSLRFYGTEEHSCAGTLLSSSYILTAAHCVDHFPIAHPANITVVGGITNRSDSERYIRNVDRIYLHPDYTSSPKFLNNIALLHVDRPFYFEHNPVLAKTCVHHINTSISMDGQQTENGTRLVVIGWGAMRPESFVLSDYLRQIQVYAIDDQDQICKDLISNTELQFCAGLYEGGKDTCLGDSGGPILYWTGQYWEQVGVIGHSSNCGRAGYPGIYTRLAYYWQWMEDILSVTNEHLEPQAPLPVSTTITTTKTTTRRTTRSTTFNNFSWSTNVSTSTPNRTTKITILTSSTTVTTGWPQTITTATNTQQTATTTSLPFTTTMTISTPWTTTTATSSQIPTATTTSPQTTTTASSAQITTTTTNWPQTTTTTTTAAQVTTTSTSSPLTTTMTTTMPWTTTTATSSQIPTATTTSPQATTTASSAQITATTTTTNWSQTTTTSTSLPLTTTMATGIPRTTTTASAVQVTTTSTSLPLTTTMTTSIPRSTTTSSAAQIATTTSAAQITTTASVAQITTTSTSLPLTTTMTTSIPRSTTTVSSTQIPTAMTTSRPQTATTITTTSRLQATTNSTFSSQMNTITIVPFEKITYECNRIPDECGCSMTNVVMSSDNQQLSANRNAEIAYPYSWSMIVSVRVNGIKHTCTGTILSDSFILTTAQCVSIGSTSNDITIAAGIHSLSQYITSVRKVDQVHIYENYTNNSPHLHNIAILRLEQSLELKTQPIFSKTCLPDIQSSGSIEDSRMMSVGWGHSETAENVGNTLQQVSITTINNSNSTCFNFNYNDKYQFCAGLLTNNLFLDSCESNFGEPVFVYRNKYWEQSETQIYIELKMSNKFDVRVDETVHHSDGKIAEVDYAYVETRDNGEVRDYRVSIKREDYERLAKTIKTPTLSFDSFAKVLRPFMMGQHASEDILQAFRLLDTDRSGTIDIGELAAFMPVIMPNANPYMLLHHVQKADKNGDYKLDLNEFTALINQGVGRDIALGRL